MTRNSASRSHRSAPSHVIWGVLCLALAAGAIAPGCAKNGSAPAPVNANHLAGLESAWRAAPCDPGAGMALAEAYRLEDQVATAKAVYTELLACGEATVQGHAMNALAQLEHAEGNSAAAASWLWQSTGLGSPTTQSQAWFLLAEFIRESEQVPAEFTASLAHDAPPLVASDATWAEAAEIAYLKAQETGSVDPRVFRGLGDLAAEREDWSGALESYQIYLAGNPGDMEACLTAAEFAQRLGQREVVQFYLELVSVKGTQEQRREASGLLESLQGAPES